MATDEPGNERERFERWAEMEGFITDAQRQATRVQINESINAVVDQLGTTAAKEFLRLLADPAYRSMGTLLTALAWASHTHHEIMSSEAMAVAERIASDMQTLFRMVWEQDSTG